MYVSAGFDKDLHTLQIRIFCCIVQRGVPEAILGVYSSVSLNKQVKCMAIAPTSGPHQRSRAICVCVVNCRSMSYDILFKVTTSDLKYGFMNIRKAALLYKIFSFWE